MRWGRKVAIAHQALRVAFVLGFGALNAACFQPVYGTQPLGVGDSVRDKLAAVEVAQIPAPNGHPESRLAVELRNNLMSEFNNGAAPSAPLYRLNINGINSGIQTVIVDVASGRPDTQVSAVNVGFTLTEIATGRVVLNSSTFGRASFDIPGSAQQFAQQRAWLNAEDRAIGMIADSIRHRLASYFVAGT